MTCVQGTRDPQGAAGAVLQGARVGLGHGLAAATGGHPLTVCWFLPKLLRSLLCALGTTRAKRAASSLWYCHGLCRRSRFAEERTSFCGQAFTCCNFNKNDLNKKERNNWGLLFPISPLGGPAAYLMCDRRQHRCEGGLGAGTAQHQEGFLLRLPSLPPVTSAAVTPPGSQTADVWLDFCSM